MPDQAFLPVLPALPARLDPARPLLGLRILLVEDSRYAAEAVRQMCLRSGARLRRADSLASARRHLAVGLPHVMIVDMGLPDGNGADLLSALSESTARIPALLGLSGDPDCEAAARAAGATGFLAKPLGKLATFQETVLDALPDDLRPAGLRALPVGQVDPDRLALRDDLVRAADLLEAGPGGGRTRYLAQFLAGLARSAGDTTLLQAAVRLGAENATAARAALGPLLQDRLGRIGITA